jgi:chromosome segregation ATPase
VASISPALEQHYKKYFTDRRKVLALHDNYASVFAGLQARGNELSAQLTELKSTITEQTAKYNADVSALNSAIASFNHRAGSGGFSSKSEFDSERVSLVARAAELDATRTQINTEVAQYNALREELKKVASQSEALNQSIDSSLEPVPSVSSP